MSLIRANVTCSTTISGATRNRTAAVSITPSALTSWADSTASKAGRPSSERAGARRRMVSVTDAPASRSPSSNVAGPSPLPTTPQPAGTAATRLTTFASSRTRAESVTVTIEPGFTRRRPKPGASADSLREPRTALGVGVGDGSGEADGSGVGVGVGSRAGVGVGSGVGVGVGSRAGVGVGSGVGVGVGSRVAAGSGVGVSDGAGVGSIAPADGTNGVNASTAASATSPTPNRERAR